MSAGTWTPENNPPTLFTDYTETVRADEFGGGWWLFHSIEVDGVVVGSEEYRLEPQIDYPRGVARGWFEVKLSINDWPLNAFPHHCVVMRIIVRLQCEQEPNHFRFRRKNQITASPRTPGRSRKKSQGSHQGEGSRSLLIFQRLLKLGVEGLGIFLFVV